VLIHLLLKLCTDAQLILPDLHLNGILLLLELFNVVHNDFRPIVSVLTRRGDVTARAQDLAPDFLNGGGARSLGGMRKGL
jgi:hypothetical protein